MTYWGRCSECARWFHLGDGQFRLTVGCPACGAEDVRVRAAVDPWQAELDDRHERPQTA